MKRITESNARYDKLGAQISIDVKEYIRSDSLEDVAVDNSVSDNTQYRYEGENIVGHVREIDNDFEHSISEASYRHEDTLEVSEISKRYLRPRGKHSERIIERYTLDGQLDRLTFELISGKLLKMEIAVRDEYFRTVVYHEDGSFDVSFRIELNVP